MSDLDTPEAPREWIRFSNEPEFDSETYWSGEAGTAVDDDQWERFHRRFIGWFIGVVTVMGLLTLCSGQGYSLGPGGGQTVICESAGGRMIDRVVVHRCAP